MLKSLVPHFYPKMHLDAYWRLFLEIRLDYHTVSVRPISTRGAPSAFSAMEVPFGGITMKNNV